MTPLQPPTGPPRGPTPPSRGPTPPSRGPSPPKAGPPPRPVVKPTAAKPKPAPRRELPRWLERARRLIVQPTAEWAAIAGEFSTAGPIYRRYLIPMAAIGPLAATVGALVFGVRTNLSSLGETYSVTAADAITSGVLDYGLSLAGVFALALLIELLAGALGGNANRVQALKVAAYGGTPYWLGGVLALIPKLAPLGLLFGLYSIRLFAVGLPPVMKVPREKNAAATLLVSMAAIIVVVVVSAITSVFV